MNYTPEEIENIKQRVRREFPQRIRNIREASELSQDAFAKALGVSRAAIGYYENGDRLPDISFLATVYERTGCNIKYLLGYADTMASYEYTNYALNYELTDVHMQNLQDLLECSIFKELLANKEFSTFFMELEYLVWSFSHDERTRAIIEYLCIASLGRMVGKAFLESTPWKSTDDSSEQMNKEVRDEIMDAINTVLEDSSEFIKTKRRQELIESVKEESKNDPFCNFRKSLKLKREEKNNAET